MISKSNVLLSSIVAALVFLLIIGCGDDDNPTGPVNVTVTDIDGNIYKTIKIGDQVWMAENLKVTHYRNGEVIPKVTDPGHWRFISTGAYCEYDNDSTNVDVYGRLYNWYTINDTNNIAPEGWHVPTDEEWKQLEMYLGMSQESADSTGNRGTDEGGQLKKEDTIYWNSPNTGATNSSGFSAIPGGSRIWNPIVIPPADYYGSLEYAAYFWSATENGSDMALVRRFSYSDSRVRRINNNGKTSGLSVRCVKD